MSSEQWGVPDREFIIISEFCPLNFFFFQISNNKQYAVLSDNRLLLHCCFVVEEVT